MIDRLKQMPRSGCVIFIIVIILLAVVFFLIARQTLKPAEVPEPVDELPYAEIYEEYRTNPIIGAQVSGPKRLSAGFEEQTQPQLAIPEFIANNQIPPYRIVATPKPQPNYNDYDYSSRLNETYFILPEGEPTGPHQFVVPIRYQRISQGVTTYHTGIDFIAHEGTPVVAAKNGTVTEVTTTGGWGRTVVIDHSHGLVTRYAHMSRIMVQPDQVVKQGDIVGYSGNTGDSSGPHLHFECRLNGKVIKPF